MAADVADGGRPVPTDGRILARLRDILVEQMDVGPDRVTPQSHLRDDLGMDSLDVVQFQMAAEEVFGVVIPEDELDRLATVRDAAQLVEQLLRGTPGECLPAASGGSPPC